MLTAAGTDRANLVRTDQYYTTVKAVPPYQQVRREFLRGRIPPSTSIAQQGLLLPGADMNIQALGVIPQKGFEVIHHKHEALAGRPTSGYSPAVTVGDFIFIPGITSLAVGSEPRRNGVASAALMTEGAQWAGQPIKLETEFIIKERMVQSLALAGAGLEDVVHAQVYLTDRDDLRSHRRRSTSSPASNMDSRPTTARSRSTSWRSNPAARRSGAPSTPACRLCSAISRRR